MFHEIRDHIINIVTSRLTVLTIMFFFFAGVLVYRCFNLQIINGEEYLNDFILQIEKTRDITSTRGRILDRNGNVLAENELAYSVKIEDVFESSRNKNAEVNDVVYRLIKLIEKNGDSVITDFKIVIDEDGDYVYSVDGTALLRFQADVLGYKTVDKLSEEEKAMTAQELMEYLSRAKGFAIGQYEDPEDRTSPFIVGKGYTKEEWLQMVTIRYAMNLTSFRKYVGTTVATNVSEKTVAVIMENSDQLDGVSIVEDTVRHYIDSKYFAHILGYTGKISSDELTDLNEQVVAEGGNEDAYTINDVVGKSGIESYMETTLQGTKGSEKVVVDNTGKVITILERKEAQPGADVYLTIDKDLTEAVYNIVEQKLAGLVSSKIINAKEFNLPENAKSSSIKIPIYDVYFTMINNNILDRKHFEAEDAGETERAVYAAYLEYKQGVYDKLNYELTEGGTPYNKLSKEYQVYQSNIVSLLRDDGVIMKELVDDNDATQIAWAKDEVISLKEYLQYCIAMNWIDVSRLDLNEKYSDSAEVYNKLQEYIIETIEHTTEIQKEDKRYASTINTYASTNGRYTYSNETFRQKYADIMVNFDKQFAEIYHATINAGTSFEEYDTKGRGYGGQLLLVPNKFVYSNIDPTQSTASQIGGDSRRRNFAVFASAELSWNSALYLTLTGRADKPSQLVNSDDPWIFYPSVGLSAIVTELLPNNIKEKLEPTLGFLKVRASYTEVGSPIPYTGLTPGTLTHELEGGTFKPFKYYPISNLKAERTRSYEVGLDSKWFNNTITFGVTYYHSNTYNQLLKATLGSNFEYMFVQAGNVQNRGLELSLGFDKKFGDFNYNTTFTATTNKNKIIQLARDVLNPVTNTLIDLTDIQVGRFRLREGGEIGTVYANEWLKRDGDNYIDYQPGQALTTETTSPYKLGSVNPKWNLGWQHGFSYKGFNLNLLFTARIGGIVISKTQAMLDRYGVSEASADARDAGGVSLGYFKVDPKTYYDAVSNLDAYYTYSATNVRLQEARLTYTFPNKWFKGTVNNLSLSVYGTNLWMIYNKAPYDPELTASTGTFGQGYDYFMLPSQSTYGLSLKFGF